MKWLKFKWGNLKRRWRLAIHGENIILNAIDAIQVARDNIEYPMSILKNSDIACTREYMRMAIAQLKHVIDYEDEPEPIYPDEEHEANGLMHVVPRHFRQQENA